MKTTDLIPIILYQLKDQDKYGLEIVDAISQCSNGRIDIKQTTLYPLLKKLEKSKFISSYWQDSDIGGKRHYYKITTNGLAQLETYPSIDELINKIFLESENVSETPNETPPSETIMQSETLSKDENETKIYSQTIDYSENEMDNELDGDENAEFDGINNTDYSPILSTNDEHDTQQSINQAFDDAKPYNEIVNEDKINQNEPFNKNSEENINLFSNINEKPKNCPKNKDEYDIFNILTFDDEKEEEEKLSSQEEISDVHNILSNDEQNIELVNPFKDNNEKTLSEKTNLEVNEDNIKIVGELDKADEFANNKHVSTFTKKQITPAKEVEVKSPIKDIFEPKNISQKISGMQNIDVEYRDYIDYKSDIRVIETKHNARKKLLKTISSTALSLVWLTIILVLCVRTGITPIFSVIFGATTLFVVFYFCRFIGNYKTMQLDIFHRSIKYNFKNQILWRFILFIALICILLVLNWAGLKNGNLFSRLNFGNFLAPITLSILLFTDYILAFIFYRNRKTDIKNTD